MWLKKIKKRKMQHFLIAFLIMIATAMLLACVSSTLETKHFVDEYFRYDNCPIVFDMVTDEGQAKDLEHNSDVMNFIKRIDLSKEKYIQDEFYNGDRKLKNDSLFLHEIDDVDSLGYGLPIADGEQTTHPGTDEIWICHVYADAEGLKVGDTFTFGDDRGHEFTISAIVDTPECSSGFIDNYPCYVNSQSMSEINGLSGYGVCMYAKNDSISIKELNQALPLEYKNNLVATIDRESLKLCLLTLANIFGGIGIGATLVILIVSIVVIRYLIRTVIDKEYHLIGIYRAIGKSTAEIYRIYFLSYMITGIVGIGAGIIVGRPLAVFLGKNIVNGIKGFHLTNTTNVIMIFVVIFMISVLLFHVWHELRKVKNITPIQALSVGIKSSKKKITHSVFKNAQSSAAMAVNQIFKKKGMSLLTILILTVAFYIGLLSGASMLSLNHYADDKNIWENLPNYSGYIKTAKSEDVDDFLRNSSSVIDYVKVDLNLNGDELKFEDCDITQNAANPMVYSDFTEDRYQNVPFSSGRICTNPYEITVSDEFLSKAKKALGDYMTISINGKKADFLIVGTYASQMRGGVSLYLQEQDLEDLGAKADLSTVLFFLKKGVSYQEFEDEFKSHFTSSKIYEEFEFIEQEQDTVNDIAKPIMVVLFISFEAFGILNIINVTYSMNRENRRKYGILKAMGFSTGYICRQVLFQLGIESLIACVLTVILQIVVSPALFSLACGVHYIYNPIWLNIAACGGNFILIMLIASVMLIPVRKITPVELMEE